MLKEALHSLLTTHNHHEDYSTHFQLLHTRILKNAISQGKKVHTLVAHRFKIAASTIFHNKLIYMYVKCGCLMDARKVFDYVKERDIISWNTIIAAYKRNGYPQETIRLFHHMLQIGYQPDQYTFASVLPACAKLGTLEQGMDIHKSIEDTGILSDVVVATALVDMYAKCGSIDKAREVFDRTPQRNVFLWTAMIAGYAQNTFVLKALETFKQMQLTGLKPDSATFASILSACAKMGALEQGVSIHQCIMEWGFLSDITVGNALVDMYAKCGSVDKANELFERMPRREVASWNIMIGGYVQNGLIENALETFKQMQLAGVKSDATTFASILPACAKMKALKQGMDIHRSIVDEGFVSDIIVGNALIDLYAKCEIIDKAGELFYRMSQKDVISWNAMIAGYAQNGFVEKALKTFKQMRLAGLKPNSTTFASILPACAKSGALEHGMNIHQSIIEGGLFADVIVATALVDMYAKCGSTEKARELFDMIAQRLVITWNVMIAGYTQNGYVEKALDAFKQMQSAGVKPNSTTFASTLPACAKMGALEQGVEIHQIIEEGGFFSDIVVATALIDMYAKCGSIAKARVVFDRIPQRDIISWNTMISGYAQSGFTKKALESFKKMQLADVTPDSTTFASILPICAQTGALKQAMGIHQSVIEGGFYADIVVGNALIDMYAKCGSIDKARELFDRLPQRDVISWNAMIAGYAKNGFIEMALESFKQMLLVGLKPNPTTFATILSACTKIGALEQGMDIHQSIMEGGFFSDIVVATALVDMYAKCGSIDKARELFDRMPERNLFLWTAMIAGYAQNGFVEKALETFKQMQLVGIKPDSTTFSSILPACAKMGALEQGIDIHQSIMEGGFSSDIIVGNALVDMYAKCGSIEKARELFDKMPERNVVSWNVMIAGYAHNGLCTDALKIFELWNHSGVYADNVSFVCVLFACSHAGLVDKGCTYFNRMNDHYCIAPMIDHYVCMVDLLARAGYLEDTLNFIIKMPVKPLVVVWKCFLSACKSHMNIGLGVFTATLLFDLDPKNPATYILLSNIFAEAGKWSEAQKVRRLMKERGIKKIPGCSWIEGHKIVHAFCVGARSHP